ncbi:hypothetical protein HHI36_014507 [Cryptolaemus montrouzieri]|uniref:Uncharacterized protein n=1 Tax=Cryptolaemus montrouzieri TaxID=559131 RepID=A0ABD2N2R5_9CUCU
MVRPASTSTNPMTATSSSIIAALLTSSATIDTRLLRSPTVMNATPSTSSGTIQSNIANLLPFPTQTTREKPIREGQMKQNVKILTSTPFEDSYMEKENKKALQKHQKL